MAKNTELVPQKKVTDDSKEITIKVKLKCYKDIKDKDGKVVTKTPDETVTLPREEALKLINDAMAIKV